MCASPFQDSLWYPRIQAGRKPGSRETSTDCFHLDHIRYFADTECWSRGGVRGAGFSFPPLHPFLSSLLSNFSFSLLPAALERENESLHKSSIPCIKTFLQFLLMFKKYNLSSKQFCFLFSALFF